MSPEQKQKALSICDLARPKPSKIPDYYTRLKQMESEGKAAMSGKDISSAIQNILDMVKGLGDDASGSDALRAIFDGVKGNCSDKQGILKMVGEAFQQP